MIARSGKIIAVLQSNYIPWKGYFDLIHSVEECILYDDMLYTKNDWRNRNLIKTPQGPMWLTIPVNAKGRCREARKICETTVSDPAWTRKHWKAIVLNYSRAPCFGMYREQFEDLYLGCQTNNLSQINYRFLCAICAILGIQTKFTWSMDFSLIDGRIERLIDVCQQVGAARYLSGPAAKTYLDENLFRQAHLTVEYADYSGYPEYPQLFPPFDHHVSIIDLIFNLGSDAPKYMKSF